MAELPHPPFSAPPALRAVPRRRRAELPAAPGEARPEPPRHPPRDGGWPPIERLPRGGRLPASAYQQWTWDMMRGRLTFELNIPFADRFVFPLSLAALLASLAELERRHEGLRSRLVEATEPPWRIYQVIDPPGTLEVPLVDLSRLPRQVGERELGRIALADAHRLVEARAKPMARVQVVRLGAADHAVLWTLSHLIGDGRSVEILRSELVALYAAFAAGRPSPLPELPVQFADFAGWQRRIEGSPAMARQLDYWRRRLARAPHPLVLPGDWPNRGWGTEGAACAFSPADSTRIRGLARDRGATPALVALAALGLLLARYTGETDILVEAKVLGRPRAELASVVGLFMNSLAHRTDLSGRPGFAEALRRTRDGVVEDYCHQDLPFPRLLGELFPGRQMLSRVAFNMLSFGSPDPFAAADREARIFSYDGRRPDMERAKYDFVVSGREDPRWICWVFQGSASRFLGETVAAIAADFKALVLGALDEPEAPVERLLPVPRYRYARSLKPEGA